MVVCKIVNNSNPAWSTRQNGSSIVELLISMVIMSVVAVGLCNMLLTTYMVYARVSNKTDNLNSAQIAIDRIRTTVRMARNIGDVFGDPVQVSTNPSVSITAGSPSFPSSQDPLYGGGQTPTGGWPASPWPSTPYTLSPQTLIVQVPVFDANGFATKIPKGTGNPANPNHDQANVDTYIFQVLPDPAAVGQFMLQGAMFPGQAPPAPATQRPYLNPPVTLCKAITGPLDNSGNPLVFLYLDKTDGSHTPRQNANAPNLVGNFSGVIMNLELLANTSSRQHQSIVPIKTEVYMRNNSLSTMAGN